MPFGARKKGFVCQLIDCYTLFYFRFIRENLKHDTRFWTSSYATPVHATWAGLAFERLCLLHVDGIKKALGVSGVVGSVCSWRGGSPDAGGQIDLLIDRDDRRARAISASSKLPNENRPNCRMAIAPYTMICYNICRYGQL
jgi:hypothetical protein